MKFSFISGSHSTPQAWDDSTLLLVRAFEEAGATPVVVRPEECPTDRPAFAFNDMDVRSLREGVPFAMHVHSLLNDGPALCHAGWYREWLTKAMGRARALTTSTLFAARKVREDGYATHRVGFPLRQVAAPRQGRAAARHLRDVVVPGRVDLDRHPAVLAEALLPLAMRGTKVTFSSPKGENHLVKVLRRAALQTPKLEDGRPALRIETDNSREAYYALIDEAAVVVIGSSGDAFNVSAAEAVLRGIPVVAPNLGGFGELVDKASLYRPHYIAEIRDLALRAWRSPTDPVVLQTRPSKVARRILNVLRSL